MSQNPYILMLRRNRWKFRINLNSIINIKCNYIAKLSDLKETSLNANEKK